MEGKRSSSSELDLGSSRQRSARQVGRSQLGQLESAGMGQLAVGQVASQLGQVVAGAGSVR